MLDSRRKHDFDSNYNVSDARKRRKVYYANGGEISGPSHKNGGVTLEVEGGEFVVKKDAVEKIVKKHGKDALHSINNGVIPKK